MIVNESVSQQADQYFEGAKIVKRIGLYSDTGKEAVGGVARPFYQFITK
ncbi:hypothetical protein [Spirosoma flavum]